MQLKKDFWGEIPNTNYQKSNINYQKSRFELIEICSFVF
jgi:hypothetical protein